MLDASEIDALATFLGTCGTEFDERLTANGIDPEGVLKTARDVVSFCERGGFNGCTLADALTRTFIAAFDLGAACAREVETRRIAAS